MNLLIIKQELTQSLENFNLLKFRNHSEYKTYNKYITHFLEIVYLYNQESSIKKIYRFIDKSN